MECRLAAKLTFPLLLAFFSIPGCGQSKAVVRGKVTYKNNPLTSGEVVFIGKPGTVPRAALINSDGMYRLDDAPTGEVKVTVVSFKTKGPVSAPAVGGKIIGKTDSGKLTSDAALPRSSAIPDKYKDPKTSDLAFTVSLGSQTIDIELKD
jgi:hypothetical protein